MEDFVDCISVVAAFKVTTKSSRWRLRSAAQVNLGSESRVVRRAQKGFLKDERETFRSCDKKGFGISIPVELLVELSKYVYVSVERSRAKKPPHHHLFVHGPISRVELQLDVLPLFFSSQT